MKIAQIAPLYEAVPPKLYGGTELVVAALSEGLLELGHDVTVFATGDSRTKGRLVAARDQALRLDDSPLKSDLGAHLAMLHEVRRQARSFDVLHFHTELLHFPVFEGLADRCVTTLHGRLDLKDLDRAYGAWDEFGLVSISDQQRAPLPQGNWLATVPHGLPADAYHFSPRPGRYLAFLGRMAPEKGPDAAIRVALAAQMPIRIAAKIDAADRAYFEAVVKPLLKHSLVEFVGEIGQQEKSQFLGDAIALVFPIRWPEPFGLVMIEATACGTPVVAFGAGAVPEIIEHGRSGLIVHHEAEAAAAVREVGALPRGEIRAAFEQCFTSRRMAADYLRVYAALPAAQRPQLARVSSL